MYLARRSPEVLELVDSLRQRYAGMKLIVGRDKFDEIQVCYSDIIHSPWHNVCLAGS